MTSRLMLAYGLLALLLGSGGLALWFFVVRERLAHRRRRIRADREGVARRKAKSRAAADAAGAAAAE